MKPPPVESEDIVVDRPLEDSVFTTTLSWEALNITGGELTEYRVLLVAIGQAEVDSRRKRQTDSFLSDCVISGVNNNFLVEPDTTQLSGTTSKLKM